MLKFQTDTDHGYAGLDGLHTSEYPIVRSGPSALSHARPCCPYSGNVSSVMTDGSPTRLLYSWAFGRLSADLPRLDAWNSRGTAPAQRDSIGAARIPGVSPFMQTLAYRTRGFLANRFRCGQQLVATNANPAHATFAITMLSLVCM